jgi:hypothetical protein
MLPKLILTENDTWVPCVILFNVLLAIAGCTTRRRPPCRAGRVPERASIDGSTVGIRGERSLPRWGDPPASGPWLLAVGERRRWAPSGNIGDGRGRRRGARRRSAPGKLHRIGKGAVGEPPGKGRRSGCRHGHTGIGMHRRWRRAVPSACGRRERKGRNR